MIGRVVEGARLLSGYTVKSRIIGSNPISSARIKMEKFCKNCKYWTIKYIGFGDCVNKNMEIAYHPYKELPKEMNITLELFNLIQKPNPIPLTNEEYSCRFHEWLNDREDEGTSLEN